MITLETEKQFEELKNEQTVFEFTAGWCPDCKVIERTKINRTNRFIFKSICVNE